MDLGLHGKVALVAASSRGLGLGVARELAREGARVSIASRRADDARAAAEALSAETGSEVEGFPLDAGDAASIAAWVAETITRFGGVDLLTANAGGPPAGVFDDFDDAAWQRAFEVTLLGTVRMIRAVLPSMRARGGGAILTITSSTVKEPAPRLVLSNSLRGAVTGLVKTLSVELAPDRIRINNLMPGRIDTDRVRSLDEAAAARSGQPLDAIRTQSAAAIPLGRYGTTAEFGRAAAFLLSDAASYITGSSLAIDGGAIRTVW
jgi:3-oxoacyl-[acyl-carrier protein] reductase